MKKVIVFGVIGIVLALTGYLVYTQWSAAIVDKVNQELALADYCNNIGYEVSVDCFVWASVTREQYASDAKFCYEWAYISDEPLSLFDKWKRYAFCADRQALPTPPIK